MLDQKLILADEPTSALDDDNRRNIMKLFKKLVSEQQGIVFIATHDNNNLEYADYHLSISNKTVLKNMIRTNKVTPFISVNSTNEKCSKNLFLYPNLNFNRLDQKQLPKFILIFIGLIVSVSIIGSNVINNFTENQKNTFNQLSDRSVFVVNDSLSLRSTKDYEDFQSFTVEEVNKLRSIEEIDIFEPYFEFVSYGLTENNITNTQPNVTSFTIDKKSYEINDVFSVQPLYSSDNLEYMLEDKLDDYTKDDIIISENFIDENNISDPLLGKNITMTIYIPIKQFVASAEKTIRNETVFYNYDGNIYVEQTIQGRIGAILSKSYPYDRSSYGNAFFYDYDKLTDMLKDHLITDLPIIPTFEGFPEKILDYSAYHIQVKELNQLANVVENIKSVSKNIETYSAAQNVSLMNESISYAKKIVTVVTIVIAILIIGILFFTFYLTNSSRKMQVGIMKALGVSNEVVVGIHVFELIKNAIVISAVSTISSGFLGTFLVGSLVQQSLTQFIIASLVRSILFSIMCVCISGIIPIILALKFEPVDIIRLSK